MNKKSALALPLVVVIPAAGVGKRMQAQCPKQYLTFLGKTLLEHTVERLLLHPQIVKVIIALGAQDQYFPQLALAKNPQVTTVIGGKERVDSVLAGLKSINSDQFPWVLVHDAARPCVSHQDIDNLISTCLCNDIGGLLATPVRDTMKRAYASEHNKTQNLVKCTAQRVGLWHALTPQMYRTIELKNAIERALASTQEITDESSAIELSGLASQLIEASSDNLKITRPDDLALAEFILMKQQKELQSQNN
jgi:2-C-methyl-D-erythritol 4-phosphate cytidylyltransferase